MKVLFVANVAKEHINKFHIPSIKVFKNNGCTVDVACFGDATVPECDRQYNMCWRRSPFTFKTIKGIFDLKKLIKSGKYDVVYCHTPVGGLVGRLAAKSFRKNGLKVVYCAHGLHFFKGAPLINWMVYYPIEKILAKYTDAFLTINKEDFNLVKTKFNKKMQVFLIPGIGVPFDRLKIDNVEKVRYEYRKKMNIPETANMIIYIAELLPNKNQRMLVDALELLNNKDKNFYLCLVGPDYENGKVNEYVQGKGLSEFVRILGWRNDVGELLYAADLYAASSIREGFGINLVEAMYCGLPVVATNNRGHSMVVDDGKNGFLVDIGDSKALCEKLYLISRDKDIRSKITGIDVSGYECFNIAKNIYDIVRQIVY